MKLPIYFGSIAIEANRWKNGRQPVIVFSEWISRAAAAGFDGIELWQRHYTMAAPSEKRKLSSHPVPPAVFSSYATFENTEESRSDRNEVTRAIVETGSKAVKFNLGTDASRRDEYITQFCGWSKTLPPGMQFLYECHPGDVGDTPAAARAILNKINNPRMGIIVHPFCISPADLHAWFDAFPDSLRHLHVHQRDGNGSFCLLSASAAHNENQCAILRQRGFHGSLTVEFTKGTAVEKESPDEIFENACADLQYLRRHLSQET